MADILSRFPLDITYQVLSGLSDVDKIVITRVCRPWRSCVQTWVADHTRQVYAKYQNLLPKPTPNWQSFHKAVRLSTLRPTATPSGKLQTNSMKVKFINTGKYAAWVDVDNLGTGIIRQGAEKIQVQEIHKIVDLLGVDVDLEYTGEVLHIDNDTGVVLVLLKYTLWHEVREAGNRWKVPTVIVVGFFGFSIPEQNVIWVTDRDGNTATLDNMNKAPTADIPSDWCVDYTKLKDGLFIKASMDYKSRTFQLWRVDMATGKQWCIQNDLLAHTMFDFTRKHERHDLSPRSEALTYNDILNHRTRYETDHFDIRQLPFKNAEGHREYAAICYSFNVAEASMNTATEFGDKCEDSDPKDEGYLKIPELADDEFADAQDNFLDISAMVNSFQTGAAQIAAGNPLPPPNPILGILQANAGRSHSTYIERSREFLLIFNTTTGDLVANIHLPPYRIRYRAANEDKPILELVHGIHQYQGRNCRAMQLFIRDLIDTSIDGTESVRIDVVQHSNINPLGVLNAFSMQASPFQLPESWSLTINHHVNGGTPTFSFEKTAHSLYKIVHAGTLFTPLEPNHLPIRYNTTVINPAYQIGIYNSRLPRSTDFVYGWDDQDHHDDHAAAEAQDPQDEVVDEEMELQGIDESDSDDDDIDLGPQPQHVDLGLLLHGPRPTLQRAADVPIGCDILAEIVQFEEDVSRNTQLGYKTPGKGTWEQKWMNVSGREPIYLPKEDDEGRMRAAWKTWWSNDRNRHENTQPVEVGENGVKFGGLWIWD